MSFEEPRVKLPSFKFGIYNPHLVSLRRYSCDSILGLLPDEHSKTSQLERLAYIPQSPFYKFDTPNKWAPGYELIDSYRLSIDQDPSMEKLMFLDNAECEEQWGGFKRQLPFADKRFLNPPIFHEFSIFNYTVRRLKPEILSSWRNEIGKGQILNKPTCDCFSTSDSISEKLAKLKRKPPLEIAVKSDDIIPEKEIMKRKDEEPILLHPPPLPECTGEPVSKAEPAPSCLAPSPLPQCQVQHQPRVPEKISKGRCFPDTFRI